MLILAVVSAALGANRDVPSAYATVQAAHDASNPGDVVRIDALQGPYQEAFTVSVDDLIFMGVNGRPVLESSAPAGYRSDAADGPTLLTIPNLPHWRRRISRFDAGRGVEAGRCTCGRCGGSRARWGCQCSRAWDQGIGTRLTRAVTS